jgi:hypothetical protein
MRPLVITAVLVLGACAKTPAESPPPVAAAPKAPPKTIEPDCTFETPLVAGVPGSPGHLMPSERNPNGDSELAALMRKMQKDLEGAREAVLKGEVPMPMLARHRRIRCSWPTDVKDRDETFDGFAVGYLDAVKAFDAAQDRRAAFAGIVGACRACHERACPGPIAAIDKLKIPDSRE